MKTAEADRVRALYEQTVKPRLESLEGLFFHLDFNKALHGTTLVEPEKARNAQLGERLGFRLVSLESREFDRV